MDRRCRNAYRASGLVPFAKQSTQSTLRIVSVRRCHLDPIEYPGLGATTAVWRIADARGGDLWGSSRPRAGVAISRLGARHLTFALLIGGGCYDPKLSFASLDSVPDT